MPTVDELILRLSIDNADFRKSIDGVQEQLRKLSEESKRHTGAVERGASLAAGGFTKLRNEILGLMTAFASASAIISFTKRLTEMDAALGRAASSTGVFVRDYAAWQGAARAMGGAGDTFTKALNNIQSALGAYQAGEQSPFLAMLERMRIQIAQTRDGAVNFRETMLRIADWASQQTDIAGRNFALGRLGFSPDDIALLSQGRAAMEAAYNIAQKYVPTAADIEAAKQRNQTFYEFSAAIEQVGRTILTNLTPQIDGAAKAMQEWVSRNREWLQGGIKEGISEVSDAFAGLKTAASTVGTITNALVGENGLKWALTSIATYMAAGWLLGPFGKALAAAVALNEVLISIDQRLYRQLDTAIFGKEHTDKLFDLREKGRQQFWGWLGNPFGMGLPQKEVGGTGQSGVSRSEQPINREVGSTAAESIDYLVREKGWNREQAAAAVGNGIQESGLNPQAGAGTAHQGLFQWEASRQTLIEQQFRKPLLSMSRREQLDAMDWEIRQRPEGAAFFGAQGRDAASKVFTEQYERPGNYGMETPNRQALARQAQEAYQNDTSKMDAARQRAMDRLREIGKTPAPGPVIAPPVIPPPDASLRGALHPSAFQPSVTNSTTTNSSNATTHVNGPITINTNATDADGIARGLKSAIQRNSVVGQADYGLA